MARTKVEQVQCDRCKRTELLPVREGPAKEYAELEATLVTGYEDGAPVMKTLRFFDLCERCRKALANYWASLEEWERDGKPLVGMEPQAAPPLQPPPNYTPPRPHSSGKK